MSVYLTLKLFHIIFAAVTFLGFAARGYWMIVASDLLDHRVTRIAPHIIDTLFLASGIGMLLAISLNPLAQPWLLAKFGGLILYVLLGTVGESCEDCRRASKLGYLVLWAQAVMLGAVGASCDLWRRGRKLRCLAPWVQAVMLCVVAASCVAWRCKRKL